MTKETVLKYDNFVDNEYLAQYLALVNNAVADSKATQQHHVIPVCWYKYRFKLSRVSARTVANHDPLQEFKKLTPEQHLEAHRLLTLCTTNDFNKALVYAYDSMKLIHFEPAATLHDIDSLDITTTKTNQKKIMNYIAKALRVESGYKKPWEQCVAEAKAKLSL